jgi:hypothetical protein
MIRQMMNHLSQINQEEIEKLIESCLLGRSIGGIIGYSSWLLEGVPEQDLENILLCIAFHGIAAIGFAHRSRWLLA